MINQRKTEQGLFPGGASPVPPLTPDVLLQCVSIHPPHQPARPPLLCHANAGARPRQMPADAAAPNAQKLRRCVASPPDKVPHCSGIPSRRPAARLNNGIPAALPPQQIGRDGRPDCMKDKALASQRPPPSPSPSLNGQGRVDHGSNWAAGCRHRLIAIPFQGVADAMLQASVRFARRQRPIKGQRRAARLAKRDRPEPSPRPALALKSTRRTSVVQISPHPHFPDQSQRRSHPPRPPLSDPEDPTLGLATRGLNRDRPSTRPIENRGLLEPRKI
jgi:hypothetical protein